MKVTSYIIISLLALSILFIAVTVFSIKPKKGFDTGVIELESSETVEAIEEPYEDPAFDDQQPTGSIHLNTSDARIVVTVHIDNPQGIIPGEDAIQNLDLNEILLTDSLTITSTDKDIKVFISTNGKQ